MLRNSQPKAITSFGRLDGLDYVKGATMRKRIQNLQDHPESYVTTSELAEYWMVSRSQIYKHIDAGTLRAIRLGPRLLRISTNEALEFEKRAKLTP